MNDFKVSKYEIPKTIPFLLAILVFFVAGILTFESGNFYNSVFPTHSKFYWYVMAVAIESLAAALILTRVKNFVYWLVRAGVLAGLSAVIIV